MISLLLASMLILSAGPGPPCYVAFAPEGTTTEGSGYTALVAGSSGQVYLGSARYGGYGFLLELEPRAREIRKLADLRDITGEDQHGIFTQAKIHSKMSIASDGKVYFASKQGHEVFDTRPEYEDAAGYPGGHLCVHDPATGQTRDLGIPVRGEGLLWAILDEPRGRVYLKSEPRNRFLYYNLATGTVADRGNLGAACRYLALGADGVAYTIGRGGVLCRFDPQRDVVEDIEVAVEGEGGYQSPYVIALAPDGRRLYGLVGGHPYVMEFDVERAAKTVAVRNAARAIGGDLPNKDIHAAVFGKDGQLYYPVLTSGDEVHLMRFDPVARRATDLGVPAPQGLNDEAHRHLYVRGDRYRLDSIQGAAVGPDGTLYLMDIYPQLSVAIFPALTAR